MARFKFLRYLGYTLELLILFMLQETPGLMPELFGARPVLLIPAVLAVAMFENAGASMAFGLAGGLLMDFGAGSVLGFHALLLAVLCWTASILAADLLQTNFLTALLTTFCAVSAVILLQWVFYYVLSGYSDAGYALVHHYLPRLAYSFLFTPVLYYFNRAIAVNIREKE